MTSSTSNSRGAIKLLAHIGLLALIVLAINRLILAAIPFAWGDDHFNSRFNFYLDNRDAYDTLFIGSSRVYRQIDPAVYDQEMVQFEPVGSFNLGAPANFFPQTYRTFREIMAHKPQALQTIVFELATAPLRPAQGNWHTLRQIYWYDPDTTLDLLRSLWRANIDDEQKRLYTAVHLGFLLEKNINFGLGIDLLTFLLTDQYRDDVYMGQARNGFYPIEEELVTGTARSQKILADRREEFLSNPKDLARRTAASSKIYNDRDSWGEVNPVYLARMEQMLQMAEEAGVELIFALPPRMGESYKSLLPLYNALPAANRLELADPAAYPEFYDPALLFDIGHFNRAGVDEFTRQLTQELIPLRQDE